MKIANNIAHVNHFLLIPYLLSLYHINQRPWDCCPRFDFFLLILLPRILTILILMCKKGGGNNPKLNKIIDPQSIDCVLGK